MATIGLSKPYYAVYSNTGTTVSYANGGVMGKATEANIEVETTEDNNLYADNSIAETDRSFAGGTLTLSTDDLSQEVSKAILGIKEEPISEITGVTDEDASELIYDDTQETPYLGTGFICPFYLHLCSVICIINRVVLRRCIVSMTDSQEAIHLRHGHPFFIISNVMGVVNIF